MLFAGVALQGVGPTSDFGSSLKWKDSLIGQNHEEAAM